jgi:hypothetical protein
MLEGVLQPPPPSAIAVSATGAACSRQARDLRNEGSALLEGGAYGSEVMLSCEAALACQSEVVLADRNKVLSNARLQAAHQHEQAMQMNQVTGALLAASGSTIHSLGDMRMHTFVPIMSQFQLDSCHSGVHVFQNM